MRLILFFTAGVSLQGWDAAGIFDREAALYRRLQERGHEVSFVTYGQDEDLSYAAHIPGIRILCNRWGMPQDIYRRLLPMLHAPALMSADLYKTNQINGAMAAVQAARLWRKPLIARCGYLWSDFSQRKSAANDTGLSFVTGLEEKVFLKATQIVVTTALMQESIVRRIPNVARKIQVIPNYVLCDHCYPLTVPQEFDLVTIGRLSDQKNTRGLLQAIRDLKCRLLLIGEKESTWAYPSNWKSLLAEHLEWHPRIGHNDLPQMIRRAKIFILPSLYEGHPKALIEAMSCGMPVIGADSPGIREIIKHGENGLLCGTDAESITAVAKQLLDNPGLQQTLGQRAREFAVKHYSLDRIVEQELTVMRSCSQVLFRGLTQTSRN